MLATPKVQSIDTRNHQLLPPHIHHP
jgi:hypothetical protein